MHLGGERRERRLPAVLPAELLQATDECQGRLHRGLGRGGQVRALSPEEELQAHVPFVADRDAVPAARLADDQEVRGVAGGQGGGPAGGPLPPPPGGGGGLPAARGRG